MCSRIQYKTGSGTHIVGRNMDWTENVVTSYSIHYTKLYDIGVDLEYLKIRPNWPELAQTICPPPQSPPDSEQSFYRSWCRKEALAKATGQGITQAVWHTPVDGNFSWQGWHQPKGCGWYRNNFI